ncbi:hypothetical protein LBMAG42_27170 [Deltaproteobacteria bacterium]|nr:hypothetical protein LBMAG42_27170 [Deltaproteobacteria bacterium]
MLPRPFDIAALVELLSDAPIVTILGARQVGKTTLARALAPHFPEVHHFDLEDPEDLARLAVPKQALSPLRGLIVIDEVQRQPELFPLLRVLADRIEPGARFLLLGSASLDLVRGASESLAGRVAFMELGGFGLADVGVESSQTLWLRGGLPRAFLARDDASSYRWRGDYIQSVLERDLPALGLRLPADAMRRFWTMLAHYHGQAWNGSELGRAMGVPDAKVRQHLDVLVGTFLVRRLEPWFTNDAKRVVKSPKVYVADTGLLHRLLQLRTHADLTAHPKVGASWEGFCIEAIARRLGARRDELWTWGLHSGAELDLFAKRGTQRLGFEVKLTDAPRVTPSMRSALAALKLDRLYVVHAGAHSFPMEDGIQALALSRLLVDLEPW